MHTQRTLACWSWCREEYLVLSVWKRLCTPRRKIHHNGTLMPCHHRPGRASWTQSSGHRCTSQTHLLQWHWARHRRNVGGKPWHQVHWAPRWTGSQGYRSGCWQWPWAGHHRSVRGKIWHQAHWAPRWMGSRGCRPGWCRWPCSHHWCLRCCSGWLGWLCRGPRTGWRAPS